MINMLRLLISFALISLSVVSNTVLAENMCSDTSSSAETGTLYDSGGPGGNYGNRENCSFLIQPSSGGNPTLSFSQFNVRGGESLTIFDGSNDSAPTLATFSNGSPPSTSYTSTSGALFVRFISNNGGNTTGFAADWTTSTGGGSCSATVADDFDSVSYSQNDGSENWTTSWLEIGENDGPSSGISRVNSSNCTSGNCLRIGEPSGRSSWVDRGAQREADLSTATSATLTFNYYTGRSRGSQSVRLQVSDDGGSSWNTLQTYNITGTSFTATPQSFDISAYTASNTRIRFISDGNNATIGLYVDDIEISYSSPCAPATPTTEWRLDESSWDGTNGEVKDAIGSLDGTAFNASTVNGQVCKAGDLSADSNNDYLLLDGAALDGATDFSVSIWGKSTGTGIQTLFSGSSGSQHNEFIMYFTSPTTFNPYLKGNGSGSISINNIADNNWHHFVWTRNGTQSCLYMDSILQGCLTKSSQALSINSGGLIIGQEQDSLAGGFATNQDWEGLIDEPLIFKTALSQSEITAIYNNQSAGNGWDGAVRSCPSLVAEWRMNEFQWSGTTGEVLDSSGNSHNGTALNGTTTADSNPAIPGNPGTCGYGSFDGTDDYVEIPHHDDLNGTTALTYTAWINPDQWGGIRQVLAKSVHGGGSGRAQMGIFSENGLLTGRAETNAGRINVQTSLPATGTWTHIALAFSDTSLTLYINGASAASDTFSATTLKTNSDPLNISKRVGTSQYFFDGLIDEVRIYRGSLSANEVQAVMNETTPCTSTTPRAEWRFDETNWDGTANEVLDSSANNYHGFANNSTPTTGLVCNAADLSANSNSDYLSLNSSAFNGVDDFTLSLWAKTDATSGQRAIVSGSTGSIHNELIMWFPNASSFQPFLKNSNSGGSISIANMGDDQWHHYVWTRSGSQNCLYRDGVAEGCVNRSSATLSIAPTGLIIGQEQDQLAGGFQSSQDFQGLIDEMMLFDGVLSQAQIQSIYNNNLAGNNWNGAPRDCGASLDHLNISHSGNGLTCEAEPVSITAHLADHTTDTSYTQTITLSTSTNRGDWSIISGNGSLNNGTINDGAASYTFVAGDNGTVQLGLRNTLIETLNINVTDGSISETSGSALASDDPDLIFNETGLRFLVNNSSSDIGTQISGKNSDIAPGAAALELQAIRTSPLTGACEAALVGNNDIEFGFQCHSPGSCSTQRVTINGTTIAANDSGSVTNYLPVSLNFGDASDSTATFIFNYPDAGRISLHARYNLPLEDGNPSGQLISVDSNNFVVKPAGLCVEATDITAACSAGNHSCTPFKKAGENFSLRVKGVGWESSGEADSDFCNGSNQVTDNFQLDNITLTSNLISPSAGANATLGVTSINIAAADTGSHTSSSQSITEVGVFTITATPPSYLGETIDASSSSNIGRFYPDHFTLSSGSVTEACTGGSFSYLGQDFTTDYQITAKNTAGVTTTNYRDSFVKLNTTLGSQSFGAIDLTAPTLLSSRLTQIANSTFIWNNSGTGTITSTLNLARLQTAPGNSIVDGPFTAQIGVLPTDADGVTVSVSNRNLNTDNNGANDHVLLDTSSQRFGRFIIDNAFGPEALDLPIPVRAEYWDGTAFIANTDDSVCPGSQFIATDFGISDPDTGDSLTPSSVNPVTYSTLVGGEGSLLLSAPNTDGALIIGLTPPAWLRFDFDGNGSDDNPSGRAVFGQYRGNDRIIYWLEQF